MGGSVATATLAGGGATSSFTSSFFIVSLCSSSSSSSTFPFISELSTMVTLFPDFPLPLLWVSRSLSRIGNVFLGLPRLFRVSPVTESTLSSSDSLVTERLKVGGAPAPSVTNFGTIFTSRSSAGLRDAVFGEKIMANCLAEGDTLPDSGSSPFPLRLVRPLTFLALDTMSLACCLCTSINTWCIRRWRLITCFGCFRIVP